MRTTTRFLFGLTAAGVVAAGGSAYTQGLTFRPGNGETVGYGTATVSGATVRNITYNINSSDSSALTDVTFIVSGDLTADADTDLTTGNGYKITMTLNGTSTPISCPAANRSLASGNTSVRCDTTMAVASVQSVHLTVTPV